MWEFAKTQPAATVIMFMFLCFTIVGIIDRITRIWRNKK